MYSTVMKLYFCMTGWSQALSSMTGSEGWGFVVDRQQAIHQIHQSKAGLFKALVPFPIPMGMRDDMKNTGLCFNNHFDFRLRAAHAI